MLGDSYEDLVKCAYLDMKLPRKHRKFGRKAWRSKWFILRRKSHQGQVRLEYHKNEDACIKGNHKTIITLHALKDIEVPAPSSTHNHVFKLIFNDTALFLATENDTDLKEWTRLIRKLVFPASKSLPTTVGACLDDSYPVTVVGTDDSERLNLAGDYFLGITSKHLQLFRPDRVSGDTTTITQWEFDDIPRFRLQRLCHLHNSEKIFIINLAKTSHSGEAEFQFLTNRGREILEAVKYHTKRLHRGRTNEDSARSSPVEGISTSSSVRLTESSRSRSASNDSQSSSFHPVDTESNKT